MVSKAHMIEFLGAFAIAFFGAYSRINNNENMFAVGITYFLLLLAITQGFLYISGAHFNPILTLSLVFLKHISFVEAIKYVVAQILGSLTAGLALFLTVQKKEGARSTYYGFPMLNQSQKFVASGLDLVSTFLLVYIVSLLLDNIKYRTIYGPAVASVYFINILAFGSISGGCINFVEVLGPGLAGLYFSNWLFYFGAQVIGGVIAVSVYIAFIKFDPKENALEEEEAQINAYYLKGKTD